MGRSQVLFNRSKQRFKEQARSGGGRGHGANAGGSIPSGSATNPRSSGATTSSHHGDEASHPPPSPRSHHSSPQSQTKKVNPNLQVNTSTVVPQPSPSPSSSYADREMPPTPTTSNRQQHNQWSQHNQQSREYLNQEQQKLLSEEDRIQRLKQQQEGEEPQQDWDTDSRRFQEHLIWKEQEQLEKLKFLEQRQLEIQKQQRELRQKKLQEEQQLAMRQQQQHQRQRQEHVRQQKLSRQGQLRERELRLQEREQQLNERYGDTASATSSSRNHHAAANNPLFMHGGPKLKKSKTPRWQRQQQLLQQMDEEESLYELGKTIVQPQKPNAWDDTTISKGCSLDSVDEVTEVALDVGAVADALALLGIARRLRIPDHLAETVQALSEVSRETRQLMVRQAIAERRDNEGYRQDSNSVGSSSSRRMTSGASGSQFQHRLKGRIIRGVATSPMSACSQSSRSVEPKSTLTSYHGGPSTVTSAGIGEDTMSKNAASLRGDSNLSPREDVNMNFSADTEDTNYLSTAEEVSTIGFSMETPHSKFPTGGETDQERMSYPSLRPNDTFTATSHMQHLMQQTQQEEEYDNGPGELFMTYTVTEEGSSAEESLPANHNAYDLTEQARFGRAPRETREIHSMESDFPREADDYRSPANMMNSASQRMDKYSVDQDQSTISALETGGVDDTSTFTARTPDDYRSPKHKASMPARRDFAEDLLVEGRKIQDYGNFHDYDDDQNFLPEQGASMEMASIMDSTITNDPALIDPTDSLFPDIQATGAHLAASTSRATKNNAKGVRTASARGSPRAKTVRQEDEDLDDWLDSAMATKSEDNPSEAIGTNTEDDLDAWLDDVIHR